MCCVTSGPMRQLTTTDSGEVVPWVRQGAPRGGRAGGGDVATMAKISKSGKPISDIIAGVGGIAFQIHLLALKAAVGAARVREPGRCVSVMTSRLRGLDRHLVKAVGEIGNLIKGTRSKFAGWAALASAVDMTLAQVLAQIECVQRLMGGVDQDSHTQFTSLLQVGQATVELVQTTQRNAHVMPHGRAAASAMVEPVARPTSTAQVFAP